MSLRTLFMTAVTCSPTAAGVSAAFMLNGGDLKAAALLGGSACFAGLFHYRHVLYFLPPEKPRTEAPQRLQNIYYRFSQKTGLTANFDMVTGGTLMNAYAIPQEGRISIGDRLYRHLNREEIEFILGHEMRHLGHPDRHAARHAFHAPFVQGLMTLVSPLSIGVTSLSAAFGVMGCMVAATAAQFLVSRKLDRMIEYDCDRAAVEMTGNPEAAIRALVKLPQRDRWTIFSTHPSIHDRTQRIADSNGINPSDLLRLRLEGIGLDPATLIVRVFPGLNRA